jgi:hypothetical protein
MAAPGFHFAFTSAMEKSKSESPLCWSIWCLILSLDFTMTGHRHLWLAVR